MQRCKTPPSDSTLPSRRRSFARAICCSGDAEKNEETRAVTSGDFGRKRSLCAAAGGGEALVGEPAAALGACAGGAGVARSGVRGLGSAEPAGVGGFAPGSQDVATTVSTKAHPNRTSGPAG